MNSLMQAGYRALEDGSYVVAGSKFKEADGYYSACYLFLVINEKYKNPASAAAADYWSCYALTGQAAAAFGQAKTADALKQIADAKKCFTGLIEGKGEYEVVSDGLRRLARDGLAYVQTLESARKPSLPKIWLDWKAAHPSG